MTDMEQMERCPFCKGDLVNISQPDSEEPPYWVHCYNCGADGPLSDTRELAIEAWNRSAEDPNDQL